MRSPFAPDALEHPYGLYAELREGTPIFRIPDTDLWLVTRHEDVVAAAADPETFSSHISAIIYAGQGGGSAQVIQGDPEAVGAVDVLATQDPPVHTGQRKLMGRTFVPSKISHIETLARELVDRGLDAGLANGRVEWMEAVANPLPVTVIAGFLGLPLADIPELVRWSDAGVDLLSGVASLERMAECWRETGELMAYLRDRIASPAAGSVTEDVARAVGRRDLTEREGVSLLLQLVIAGSESTASLVGSAARLLAEDPALQDELRANPGRIGAFVEEALRLESPFRGHFRVTTKEATIGGVTIPAGARVMLMWGSANRDPSAFPEPERVDLTRPHPKAHVAFGSGLHLCLGAPLARLEARVAIGRLLERTSSFALAGDGAPAHVPSLFVRRLAELNLSLEPRG